MKYQIRFTQGESVGQIFPIGVNALSIGRSHSNAVRLQTPDVSGKHVNLTIGNEGVIIENFSSHTTTIDGTALAMGDRKGLIAGQEVGLGRLVKFVLEALPDDVPAAAAAVLSVDDATVVPPTPKAAVPAAKPVTSADDDATVIPAKPSQQASVPAAKPVPSSDDDATVIPAKPTPKAAAPAAKQESAAAVEDATVIPAKPAAKAPVPQKPAAPMAKAPVPQKPAAPAAKAPLPKITVEDNSDENETIAMQTRMASAEELEYMKKSHEKKKMKKAGTLIFSVLAFVAIMITVYFCFYYRKPEKYVSWPKNEAGELLKKAVQMENCPYQKDLDFNYPDLQDVEIKKTAGLVSVSSKLGKYRDVPLILRMEYFQDKDALTCERNVSLEKWMKTKTQGSENWNFDLVQPLGFYQFNHGIPYLCVPYSRTEDNESYVGYAVQIRQADWIFMFMKEIPTRDRWRAEWFIQAECFMRFSEKFLNEHWEGTDTYQAGNPSALIGEAKTLLRRRSPSVWQKAEYLLRSALLQNRKGDNSREVDEEALALLVELRNSQLEYFNAQKIAYLMAKSKKEHKGMKRIGEELKAVFSSEEDFRFYKIRQDKWD